MTEFVLLTTAWTVKETITLVVAIIMASAYVLFLLIEGKKENPQILEKGIIFLLIFIGFAFVFGNILY